MRAVVIANENGAGSLLLQTVPEPAFGPSELLVDIHAAAVNRADLRRATTHFSGSEAGPSVAIGGLEMAGEVVAVGSAVEGFSVGDRVMAMTGRSWAEQVAVDYRLALPVPRTFSWAEAAATPISFITAHDALASAAGLQPGETVLVRGASSAAGLATLQIARALDAARVFATTNASAKLAALAELGGEPLDSSSGPLAPTIDRLTDGRGVDVVIDIVGATVVQDNIDAAAVTGRIVCLGRLAGTEGTFNLDEFSRKRIRMIGVTFRTRTLEERTAVVSRFREEMLPRLEAREIRPVIDRAFPLAEIERAEQYVRDNRSFGKVVIEVRSPG
jgi:NADPH:quinone reductase-like Zn-dependent oxidoreductase